MSDVVSTTATVNPISLAEAKTHLNVSTTYDDDYIPDLISAATAYIEKRTNQCFVNQTRTLKMRGFNDARYSHGRIIHPPKGPLSSVTSITYVASADGTTTTLGTSVYDVSADNPGRVAEAYNQTWPTVRDQQDSVVVTYVCGHGSTRSDVPTNVKHAIKLLVGHWYRTREAALDSGAVPQSIKFGVDALLGEEALEHYG